MRYLRQNCDEFGIELFDIPDARGGIEHVAIPQQGLVLPGAVVVCGDSHTTTYGALGALGFGIGTSEVEHVLAIQTIVYRRLRTMRIIVDGILLPGVRAKDIILTLIGQIGASGALGYAVEFLGTTISALSVEARITICNMIVEAGARGALVAPDELVFSYLKGKMHCPNGDDWRQGQQYWSTLRSDSDAYFDKIFYLAAADIEPVVHGAPVRTKSAGFPDGSRILPQQATRLSVVRSSAGSSTWAFGPESVCRVFGSTGRSSGPAPTAVLKICAMRLKSLAAERLRGTSKPWSFPVPS